MFRRLLIWAVRAYIGGPAKSWVFTSGALLAVRLVRSTTGRRELIDLSSIKPGETMMIEHLPISHKKQIKEIKQSKRQARRSAKLERRQAAKA